MPTPAVEVGTQARSDPVLTEETRMPPTITHTREFRPGRWLGATALACLAAFVIGLSWGSPRVVQPTMTTPPTCIR